MVVTLVIAPLLPLGEKGSETASGRIGMTFGSMSPLPALHVLEVAAYGGVRLVSGVGPELRCARFVDEYQACYACTAEFPQACFDLFDEPLSDAASPVVRVYAQSGHVPAPAIPAAHQRTNDPLAVRRQHEEFGIALKPNLHRSNDT